MPKRGYITVGTSVIAVLDENPKRVKVNFTNQSDNEITVTQGHARVNEGFVLKSGGSLSDERDTFGYIYTGSYTAIANVASSVLAYTEEP